MSLNSDQYQILFPISYWIWWIRLHVMPNSPSEILPHWNMPDLNSRKPKGDFPKANTPLESDIISFYSDPSERVCVKTARFKRPQWKGVCQNCTLQERYYPYGSTKCADEVWKVDPSWDSFCDLITEITEIMYCWFEIEYSPAMRA